MNVREVYDRLFSEYGPQGWWPLIGHNGVNPTTTGSINGYHPRDYSFPKNESERFEISIGAILTQNTGWMQAEKALMQLDRLGFIDPENLFKCEMDMLREAIKPARYFNQKAKKLKEFAQFFLALDGRVPSRDQLLGIWGIGPETADSILLYAYKQPEFVVDAYTRRVFGFLGMVDDNASYDEIMRFFRHNLEKDVFLYQEYHALIVEHGKRYFSKKPYGQNDHILVSKNARKCAKKVTFIKQNSLET